MSKRRQSNIEILRVLAMFMIVAGHASTQGHDVGYESRYLRYNAT